jgi:hypothetical protein
MSGNFRMEFSFLKKQTRSHRFLTVLSQPEINAILDKYVPRLRSIQIFNIKKYPEVNDEYYEKLENIVEEARESLKDQLRTKIKKYVKDPIVFAAAVAQIAGYNV